MRYVKLNNLDPGVRFDLLRMRPVFSSRFLSSEEHGTAWYTEAWAALFCGVLAVPRLLKRELRVRWQTMTFAEFFLCALGVVLAVMLAVIIWGHSA